MIDGHRSTASRHTSIPMKSLTQPKSPLKSCTTSMFRKILSGKTCGSRCHTHFCSLSYQISLTATISSHLLVVACKMYRLNPFKSCTSSYSMRKVDKRPCSTPDFDGPLGISRMNFLFRMQTDHLIRYHSTAIYARLTSYECQSVHSSTG